MRRLHARTNERGQPLPTHASTSSCSCCVVTSSEVWCGRPTSTSRTLLQVGVHGGGKRWAGNRPWGLGGQVGLRQASTATSSATSSTLHERTLRIALQSPAASALVSCQCGLRQPAPSHPTHPPSFPPAPSSAAPFLARRSSRALTPGCRHRPCPARGSAPAGRGRAGRWTPAGRAW